MFRSLPAKPRPPRQARSQHTLERVLLAAEELLDERLFEAMGMDDVARAAGVSVGTIYTRFPGKEALLPELFRRHNLAVAERITALHSALAAQSGLRARIELAVDFALDYYQRHRGLLRALTQYLRANPGVLGEELLGERRSQYEGLAAALLGDGREVRAAEPRETALFLLGTLDAVLREQLLFEDTHAFRGRRGRALLRRQLVAQIHLGLAGTLHVPRSNRKRSKP